MTDRRAKNGPSIEQLLENGILQAEILHPGGLQITRELAELCDIGPGKRVLDVASGGGEAACFLAEIFRCHVRGVDASNFMVERAMNKARGRILDIEFRQADAHALPFDADAFDAVISECTTCVLDKQRAIQEMVRVTKPGGHVGIHDLCWKENSPDELKQRLAEPRRASGLWFDCRKKADGMNRPARTRMALLIDDGSIAVDHRYETSRPGIFAVGDVHGNIKLIPVAWAEGIQAAIYVFDEITHPYWLNEKRLHGQHR